MQSFIRHEQPGTDSLFMIQERHCKIIFTFEKHGILVRRAFLPFIVCPAGHIEGNRNFSILIVFRGHRIREMRFKLLQSGFQLLRIQVHADHPGITLKRRDHGFIPEHILRKPMESFFHSRNIDGYRYQRIKAVSFKHVFPFDRFSGNRSLTADLYEGIEIGHRRSGHNAHEAFAGSADSHPGHIAHQHFHHLAQRFLL